MLDRIRTLLEGEDRADELLETAEGAADAEGLGSHAVTALIAELANRMGPTAALSLAMAPARKHSSTHDPGSVLHDMAVMVASGGDCLSDTVSHNWRGKPLVSLEIIINLIAATTTPTELEVYVQLDEGAYPDKIKVSDAELAAVQLERDRFHPAWIHTIKPRT